MAKDLAGESAMLLNQRRIAFVAQCLCVWRFFTDESESRNATTFLINRDEWLDVRDVTQIVDEFAELLWCLNVAAEQDEAARLKFFQSSGGFRGEFESWNPHKEELT